MPSETEVTQPANEGIYFQQKYRTASNNTNEEENNDVDLMQRSNNTDIECTCTPTWRLKERMKTTGVCMILALNIGTDPPDISKPTPCATELCWLDPSGVSRAKAREIIGERLEEQYAKWQQRVKLKYKRALDPTAEETKSLCIAMRRHAKSERLLLHYNGHGVPRPTDNGELWVFDQNHTQYIPLSVQELRSWIGRPTIVVLDCSNAGVLIPAFTTSTNSNNPTAPQATTPFHSVHSLGPFHHTQTNTNSFNTGPSMFQKQKQQKDYISGTRMSSSNNNVPPQVHNDVTSGINDCIVLCPCSEGELLPMNPAYPADIFTACLTTPIPIALRWFVRRNQLSMEGLDPESVDRIPGKVSDRKTPLGEMSWIFTAITDTIAWNVLPSALFQRLFRQDLLVASMFRNFLLADRILRSLNCTPTSYPPLPMTANHPLWQSFDLAVESCLYQLMRDDHLFVQPKAGDLSEISVPKPPMMQIRKNIDVVVPFFSEQLTAFEVWLDFTGNGTDGCPKPSYRPPEELPVVLQVLLSQAHRVRALKLLKRFLNLGSWAVNLALSVGIFPYVLKLLQSPVIEYRHVLVFIWAKMLAFDISCQGDLVKDQACPHFISHLSWGLTRESEVLRDDFVAEPLNGVPVTPEDDAAEQRMMAAFILSVICQNHTLGQSECLRLNLHLKCSELLEINEDTELVAALRRPAITNFRVWLCICLARLCQKNAAVQHEFYSKNIHLKLLLCLRDPSPSVRAAAAYALGCLVRWPRRLGSQDQLARLELKVSHIYGSQGDLNVMFQDLHRMSLDILVARRLTEHLSDGSSLVRCELTLALGCVIEKYAPLFSAVYSERLGETPKVINALDEDQIKILRNTWDTLCRIAAKDPFPEVSVTGNIIVSFIKLLNQPFHASIENEDKSDNIRKEDSMIHTEMSIDQSANNADNDQKTYKPTLHRNMSDYFTRWKTSTSAKVEHGHPPEENLEENCINIGSSAVDKIPLSLFGDRKYKEFGLENQRTDEDDLLSRSGAIKAYRKKRNAQYHSHGLGLIDTFVELHPNVQEKSKPKSNSYDFRSESPALIWELRMASKKQELNMKQTSQLHNDNAAMTSILRFHPYEPIIAICDENNEISVFDYDDGYQALTFSNHNSKSSRTTSLKWINEQSNSLLLTGCDDGTVQIWDNVFIASPDFEKNGQNRLATAFVAAPDISGGRGSGLVTEWQQYSGQLFVGGNSPKLRCWDLNTSQLVNSFQNKSDSCMTVVTTAWDSLLCEGSTSSMSNIGPNIAISGYGDGSIKVFDTRCTSAVTVFDSVSSRRKPRLMNYMEHKSWIVNIFFTGLGGNYEVASGCVAGRVKFWDLRYPMSRRTIEVQRSQMTALAGHNRVPVFASGSHAQYIKLCTFDGDAVQVIRTHEHGPVSCLDFHPHKLLLAAGATDDIINIYSAERSK